MTDRWIQRRKQLLKDRMKLVEGKIIYLQTLLKVPANQSLLLEKEASRIARRFGYKDGLTEMQRKFVEEYPKDLNGTAACIRAGYSPKAAPQMAVTLLNQSKIRNALRKESARIAKRRQIQSDDVLTELSTLAYSNIEKFIQVRNGRISLTDFRYLTPQDISCVKEISEQPGKYGTILKIKLFDKMRALNLLAQHKRLLGGNKDIEATPEQAGQKVKEAVDKLFDSVPADDVRLPSNVVKLNERLDALDRKAG